MDRVSGVVELSERVGAYTRRTVCVRRTASLTA
jgi:hypothetical protein